jgi:hypothetical protein
MGVIPGAGTFNFEGSDVGCLLMTRAHAWRRTARGSLVSQPRAACQEGAPVRYGTPPRRPNLRRQRCQSSARKRPTFSANIAAKPRVVVSKSPPRGTI